MDKVFFLTNLSLHKQLNGSIFGQIYISIIYEQQTNYTKYTLHPAFINKTIASAVTVQRFWRTSEFPTVIADIVVVCKLTHLINMIITTRIAAEFL